MIKKMLIVVVLLLGLGALTALLLNQRSVDCEVCVRFNERFHCSHAVGPDSRSAREEAHRSACSVVAAGVTETLACDRGPSESENCSENR